MNEIVKLKTESTSIENPRYYKVKKFKFEFKMEY